jgi:hypothetical protein
MGDHSSRERHAGNRRGLEDPLLVRSKTIDLGVDEAAYPIRPSSLDLIYAR